MELLVRIAVRAGLALTLLTGTVPEEAGVHVARRHRRPMTGNPSRLADEARESLQAFHRRLTPSQRLEAYLEHNQLVAALHQAARDVEQSEAVTPDPAS